MYHFNTSYGAVGDDRRYDTVPIQTAIDAYSGGGDRVVFPGGGRYLTGTLHLRSHVVLDIKLGMALLCAAQEADYPADSSHWYLVLAENATGVRVTGGGVIDGQGGEYVVRRDERKNVMVSCNSTGECLGDECRSRLVGFIGSKDFRVWDVRLNQPAYWWYVLPPRIIHV